jgi:hypothetical protein
MPEMTWIKVRPAELIARHQTKVKQHLNEAGEPYFFVDSLATEENILANS